MAALSTRADFRMAALASAVMASFAIPQASAAPGDPLGPTIGILDSADAQATSEHSSMARAANGRFVAAWIERGLRTQVYRRDGTPRSPVHMLPVGAFDLDVAMDDEGEFVVAWVEGFTAERVVRAQRFDATGDPNGAIVTVASATGPSSVAWPAVAMDHGGDFVVSWTDLRSDELGDCGLYGSGCVQIGNTWIRARRYTEGGTQSGARLTLDHATAIDVLGAAKWGDQLGLSDVAMAGDGSLVVAWARNGTGSRGLIRARHYDAAGVAGAVRRVDGPRSAGELSVATNDDGAGVVAFTALDDAGRQTLVRLRTFAPGLRLDAAAITANDPGSAVSNLGVAIDPAGNFLATWVRATNEGHEIQGQRYAAGGGTLGTNFAVGIDRTVGGSWETSPAYDAQGDFLVGALNWVRLYDGP